MTKIRDDNYYQISGWMVERLKLKGNELNVFAIIYGFSQDEDCEFAGGIQYLCDFLGGVSRPTIITALKNLVQKGFIIKREEIINGVQFNRYKANLGVVKNFYGGSKEILPNNKENNIEDNKKEKQVNLLKEKAFIEETTTTLANVENQAKRFKKPTAEEIQAYCDERENGLNGQQIFDFYQAKGWVIGKSPMKDWKAAVRTWERNRKSVKKTFEGTPKTTLKRTTISIDEALAIRSKYEAGDDDYE